MIYVVWSRQADRGTMMLEAVVRKVGDDSGAGKEGAPESLSTRVIGPV